MSHINFNFFAWHIAEYVFAVCGVYLSGVFIAQMAYMSFKASCLKYIHTCQKTAAAMKSDGHLAAGFYLCISLQSFQINSTAGDRWAEFAYRSLRRAGGIQMHSGQTYKSVFAYVERVEGWQQI